MLHLRRSLLSLLVGGPHPTSAALSSSLHRRALLSTSACPAPFSIKDYLVSACGLTGAQALEASSKLPKLKSASNPDAVLALLSGAGLSRADIAAVVVSDPLLLRARANNIAPRLAYLRDCVGLSAPQIAGFLQVSSMAFRSCDVASRLEFWIPFFGSFDKLLQIVRNNNRILATNIEKVAMPNIALLKQCGLSACDIVKLAKTTPWLLTHRPERLKAFVERVDKLGVPRTSYTFKYAVGVVAMFVSEDKIALRMEFLRSTLGCSMEKVSSAVCRFPRILGLPEETLRRKIEFLRSTLGCSMEKVCAAFCSTPCILGLSEEKLRSKIEFMVTEVGLEPGYIVERPALLTYSLEKRMVPRYRVAKILQEKGLMPKGSDFMGLLVQSEDDFTKKYLDRHMDIVPGLADAYAAAHAGDMLAKHTA